jgi:PAS domain S-box-containing protein
MKMFGYSQEVYIGKKLKDVGFPRDMYDITEILHTLDRDGIMLYNDIPIKTKAGQTIDTDVYLVDRAKLVQCNIRDITEHKKAEQALRESEERYKALYNRSLDCVFVLDLEGQFIDANQAALALLGYDRTEISSLNISSLLDERDLSKGLQDINEIIQTGFQKEISIYRLRRKDGGIVYVETQGSIIYSDDKPHSIQGIARDITERIQAEDDRKQSFEQTRKALGATTHAISSLVETRDPYTAGHQRKVADLAQSIATEMNLSSDQIDGLRMAATIHDLGKISIPAEILAMPRKLTDFEFNLMKTHPQSGYGILKGIEFPWPIARMILEHHERVNGSGYPNGLTGDNLLLESRILAVADVVEAMASHRPYRPALGIDAALREIDKNKGVLYDLEVVDACLRIFNTKNYKIPD